MRCPVRCIAIASSLVLLSAAHAATGIDALLAGFKSPPRAAKPQTWWHWMNGNASAKGITADLEAMKSIGLGGAQIFNVDVGFPDGPAEFMSPKWRALVAYAAKESHRLDLELAMHNCAGWSSTGGPWVTPEHGMQVIAWSTVKVHGPTKYDAVLPEAKAPQVDRHIPYYRDIAVYAYPTPTGESDDQLQARFKTDQWLGRSGVVRDDGIKPIAMDEPETDIPVDKLQIVGKPDAKGHFVWNVPEGDWTILRMGYTPTGVENHPAGKGGLGLEVDKLSSAALDSHWHDMLDKVFADSKAMIGKGFNIVLIDSYEVGTQNWTPKFREDFQRLRGYDPLKYLPAITGRFVGSADVTDRFLWDVRRTIADLYSDNYYGHFTQLAHQHGLKFETEPYGNGGFDTIRCGGVADIPMAEFWPPNGSAQETTKLASSAAHIYGKPVVAAEAFTSDLSVAKYLEYPYQLKALGDRMFCNGINRFVFHRYAMQPWLGVEPGMTMGPWGLNFERTVTWWNQSKAWIQYLTRCQFLLQDGKFKADLLYYVGEDEPKDLPYRPNLRPEVPEGYDYDGCDTDVLLNQMTVKNGKIVLRSGESYRVLVMPQTSKMSPRVARKIRLLVREGATVIAPRPTGSPSLSDYPVCDDEVQSVAKEVWGDVDGKTVLQHKDGLGRVIDGMPVVNVLVGMGIKPDFMVEGGDKDAEVDYIHRAGDKTDSYFISNQAYRPIVIDAAFRSTGRAPEIWHPDTGVTEAAPVWYEVGGRTYVRLALDPAGSTFVVFGKPDSVSHLTSVTKGGPTAERHAPVVTIQKAVYEPDDGSSSGADVTEIVASLVAKGHTSVTASNSLFGDPSINRVKHLHVIYTIDGKNMDVNIAENAVLMFMPNAQEWSAPDYDVWADGRLVSWTGGTYTVKKANHPATTVKVPAASAVPITGAWNLTFPPNWGAPSTATFPSLMSWPNSTNEGVKYFSGTATYHKTFNLSAATVAEGRVVSLDLGKVMEFARVKLNGCDFGVLWKAPFRLNVTGVAKAGSNTLEIEVTNLWPNRLIGDEQQPPEVKYRGGGEIAEIPQWLKEGKPKPKTKRYKFVTWHFYNKNSPLLESGLIGPVTIRSAKPVKL